MIDFTNIRVEGDFIYADAENLSSGEKVKVIAQISNSYNIKISNDEEFSDFRMAALYLIDEFMNKGKLPERKEINWDM